MIADDLRALAYPIEQLDLLEGNPRLGDVEAVRRSYERFGQQKPIVARHDGERGVVIAGNHQLRAARLLGWDEIAVVWADGLSDDEARAFSLADNRTAELGGYDDDLLAEMLSYVADDVDLLAATGWSEKDIEKLVGVPEGKPAGDQSDELSDVFQVVITCRDETHQLATIEALTADGYEVKALVA